MKKRSLTTAVLAGLAGVVGFASSAGAVNINPGGTGQVLIYPYYTVNAGQQTLISVVNTSDVSKAVKVRFLEFANSQEVRDFNLFLSPYDVWAAVIFSTDDAGITSPGAGPLGLNGGAVGTSDHSCTVPQIYGGTNSLVGQIGDMYYVPFTNRQYMNEQHTLNDQFTGLWRSREGYVEMINMADVVTGSAADVAIQTKTVASCGDPSLRANGPQFTSPTGGLFGNGGVVNVASGTFFAYEADAIDGFSASNLFSPSGSTLPDLSDAGGLGGATAHIFYRGQVIDANFFAGEDAVSAVFMAESLMNEWAANAAAGVGTDWVITFPTKHFYVNLGAGSGAFAPFLSEYDGIISCDIVTVDIWDREEGTPGPGGDTFSPPPQEHPSSLCFEVNVITISDPANPVSILGSFANTSGLLATNVNPYGDAGWMKLGLEGTFVKYLPWASADPTTGLTPIFSGLPATGFMASNYILGSASANYSGVWQHRTERGISCVAAGGTIPTDFVACP